MCWLQADWGLGFQTEARASIERERECWDLGFQTEVRSLHLAAPTAWGASEAVGASLPPLCHRSDSVVQRAYLPHYIFSRARCLGPCSAQRWIELIPHRRVVTITSRTICFARLYTDSTYSRFWLLVLYVERVENFLLFHVQKMIFSFQWSWKVNYVSMTVACLRFFVIGSLCT